jgi:CheY-like chemotaxis protein
MYVEDDLDIQSIAKISLSSLGGFDLCICSSGKEALLTFPKFQPDLLLLDVMMPEMDGPSLLEQLRQTSDFNDTPVIFMTAKIQTKEVERYRSLGALDVIAKPFDPIELPQMIKNIWQKKNS